MTEVELNDKRNAVKNAGVVFTATAIPLKKAQIHISLDAEEGGQIIYNPKTCPISSWIERVYNALKAVGLIN